MYKHFLREISTSMAAIGGVLQPPCISNQVDSLREVAEEVLGFRIPKEFEDFLFITDGLNWNGLSLYAHKKTLVTNYSDRYIPGFIENNVLLRELRDDLQDKILFGDGDLDYYIYNLSLKTYQIIDKVPGDVIENISSFEELIFKALSSHL